MRFLPRALAAGGLGFAVSCIAACGGGAGLLSGGQANGLNNQLLRVSSALSAGDCTTVQSAARAFASGVANLPASVNGTLRTDLDSAASSIGQSAVRQCQQSIATTTTTTTATSTTTTAKTNTTTTPTTTTTTTPTTTTTTTPATTPTSPGTTSTGSSGGSGLGGGSGGAGSGGGGVGSPGGGNQNG